jgi:bifunctional DNase/RNase
VDFALRTGAPVEVVENLQELEDSEEPYESMEEIWPDYPTGEDFFFEDEGEY